MFGTIILAAGHGGGDPGAVYRNEREDKAAITIVDNAARILRDNRISTAIVPHKYDLPDQVKWVNTRYAGPQYLALEIHKNSGPVGATGIEVFYMATNDTRKKQAADLSAKLSKAANKKDRGAKPDTATRHKKLWWCRGLYVASLLVEMGFIQEPDNEADLGKALGYGVLEFLGQKFEPVTFKITSTKERVSIIEKAIPWRWIKTTNKDGNIEMTITATAARAVTIRRVLEYELRLKYTTS